MTAALPAAAQTDTPVGTANDPTPPADKPANGTPPATTDLVNGSPTKFGYSPDMKLTPEQQKTFDERQGKVMDGNGQLTDFNQATKDLSPGDRATAEAAMKHQLTPVIVGGKIMGYDDPYTNGGIDWLPDAVAQQLAGEIKAPPDPTPGAGAPDASHEAAAAPGHVPKPGDPDFIGPLQQPPGNNGGDTCATNPHPPCANAGNQPPTSTDQIQTGIRNNDFNMLEAGLNQQRQEDQQQDAPSNPPGGGPSLAGPGTSSPAPSAPGFTAAGTGPSPIGGGPGGQTMGQDGQVGANGSGPGAGSRQYASVHDEAASLMAFNEGLKNGPTQGPRDPNARSVFETVSSFIDGHGGHALLQAIGINANGANAVAEVVTPAASGELDTRDGGSYHAGRGFDGTGEVQPTQNARTCDQGHANDFCWNGTAATRNGTPN